MAPMRQRYSSRVSSEVFLYFPDMASVAKTLLHFQCVLMSDISIHPKGKQLNPNIWVPTRSLYYSSTPICFEIQILLYVGVHD